MSLLRRLSSRRYAETTNVSTDASRVEIERTLTRYGADEFMYAWRKTEAVVAFRAEGRHVRFTIPLPDRNAREFTHTPERDLPRSAAAAEEAYEQAVRQRWRALSLVVKAKLEAVATGIAEFENEFLAYVVLPDDTTVGERVRPQLERIYALGGLPERLALPESSR